MVSSYSYQRRLPVIAKLPHRNSFLGTAMKALVTAFATAALALGAGQAQSADPYPVRPVRIVVGYSPGTTSDVFARMIAQKLSERWGQGVLVENRDGAAGSIGAEAVARAAPDGYTLMLGSNAVTLGL